MTETITQIEKVRHLSLLKRCAAPAMTNDK
jgi:hypothetical protein